MNFFHQNFDFNEFIYRIIGDIVNYYSKGEIMPRFRLIGVDIYP